MCGILFFPLVWKSITRLRLYLNHQLTGMIRNISTPGVCHCAFLPEANERCVRF
jgi:hypothetical protein